MKMKTTDLQYACGIASFLIVLHPTENREIVKIILDNDGIKSKDLLEKSGLTPSTFHKRIQQLETKKIIKKKPQDDRTVTYHITPFAKTVLAVSKEMLHKIEGDMKETIVEN